jgi:hypothetical protein
VLLRERKITMRISKGHMPAAAQPSPREHHERAKASGRGLGIMGTVGAASKKREVATGVETMCEAKRMCESSRSARAQISLMEPSIPRQKHEQN